MIIYEIWTDFVPTYFLFNKYYEVHKVLIGIILTIIAIPIDIILLPLELIAIIVYKILDRSLQDNER